MKKIPFVALFFMLVAFFTTSVSQGQNVIVRGDENNILIQEVRYEINGQEIIQTSPEGNENPMPAESPVIITSIEIQNGDLIFATSRKPRVTNPNPVLGTDLISNSVVKIINSDNTIVGHTDADFISALEQVVSTPDLRSYWDIGSQPSIPSGERFVDVYYSDQVVTSGYLLYTERAGNSATDFVALGRNGQPIEGTRVIQVRSFQWDSGINHSDNVPTQTQELVLFSPIIFESEEPIYGIRIISINEPDGKLVFFVNALSVRPDLAERVNSELGAVGVLNIFENDELNGFALNPIDVQFEILQPFPENTVVLNPDGSVDVPPNTEPGVYTLIYQLTAAGEEVDSAEVRIEVIEYVPEAFNDNASLDDSFGQDSVLNVLDNDLLNGLPALIENVNLTVVENNTNGGLILNEDGSVDVTVGIPPGTYQLTYQICDKEDPAKCDQANVFIFVGVTNLEAVDDDFGALNLNRGGIVGNVLQNDKINGEPVEQERVYAELVSNAGLEGVSMTEEGDLLLPEGLGEGTYILSYDLIETINPTNRDRGQITISLQNINLQANDDQATTDQNQPVIIEVLDNDFLNTGNLITETLSIVQAPENGEVALNEDGTVTYTPGTNYSGEDQFIYQICDDEDRLFCDQAQVTVLVRPILLALSKRSDINEVPVGGLVTYTIQLTNNSEFDLINIRVEDLLPEALMFLSSTPEEAEEGNWLIASLPAGGNTSITLETMATGLGEVVNLATVTIGEYSDQVEANPVSILAKPVSVSISKTSGGIAIFEGNEFDYEITLSNNGEESAENVFIEDVLPDGLEFIGFMSDTFNDLPEVTGNTISWTVPQLEPGQVMVFRIRVKASQIGVISNTVSLSVPTDQVNLSEDQEDTDTNQVRTFFIPNVITPGNLDGKNDTFEIRGIQGYASSYLTILNRNGDHVFESDDYQNDWAAQGLNGGSYYYVLVLTDSQGDEQTYKGWLQVVK